MQKPLALLTALLAVTAHAELLPLADFKNNTDGFGGAFQHRTEAGRGFVVLENTAERWVEGGKDLELAITCEVEAFQFNVRSENTGRIAVRLIDATGQTFQHRLTFNGDGKWQTLEIKDFAKATQTWGGANDKKFHPQIKNVGFTLEGHGLVAIDNVALRLTNKPFIPDLAWDLATGHIFDTTAQVAIPIRSSRANIEWEVTDFWRDVVDRGTLTPVNGAATLKPAIKRPGYYLLRLGDSYVSFAVVPPFQPKNRATSPFGVMTHFAQHMDTDILPLLSRIGITSIRDEHYWKQVEQKKGVYTFSEKSDNWMAAAKANNMEPLVPMTFANPLYDDGKTPHTPAGLDAYANYGLAILKQYPHVKWLEVWNEYNGTWCDGPAATDRPRYHALMLKHVYEKIKPLHPGVTILGCATVLIPMPYLEGVFKHGGLQHMDAVVIHPYRANPEGVEDEVAELQALIRKYSDGKDKPIWATEIGRHDTREAEWETGKKLYELGRQRIARYLARQYILLLSAGVERIHWYLSRDYMEFVSMGLLRNVNEPTGRYAVAPAYAAYATLIRELDNPKFIRKADLGRFTYALLFETSNGPVWVCWATQPATIAFNANGPRKVIDIMGAETTMTPLNGQITFSLGEDVIFIRGKDEPTATPALNIAADIRTPVLGTPYFNAGKNGAGLTLKTRGQTFTLDANGQAKLPLNTSAPKTEWLQFELLKQNAVVARGTLSHTVVEALVFLPQSIQAESANTLFAQIENVPAIAPTYQFTGADWKIGGKTFATRKHLGLPPGNILSLRFNGLDKALAPYQRHDLEITAKFDNRADVAWKGNVAFNPCYKLGAANTAAIDMDKHAQRWGANANNNMKVDLRYDDAALHVKFSNTAKPILLGVASNDNSVWHVVAVDGKTLVGDTVKLAWSEYGLPKPQHGGTFRFAIAVSDNRTMWEWGTGLLMGRSPEGFNVCRFIDPAAPAAANLPEFTVLPAARSESTPYQPGRFLTDSEVDYTKEQGGNNHYYGFYPEKKYTPDAFVEMTHVETMWGYNWAAKSGYQHMQLSHTTAHPNAADGFPVWAVRRWKSDHTGKAQISGNFRSNDGKSDGVGLRVLVDGIQVANLLADGGQEVSFDFSVDLKDGSLVDFAFTPGPAVNTNYDATSYNFKIRELR